jgi:hypothetical protein
MGPLFSAALAGTALLVLAAFAFWVALVRHGWRQALVLTAAFVAGFVGGTASALTLVALVFGAGSLESPAAPLLYLSFLAGAGVLGGCLAWRWFAKRSNQSLQRTAFGVR